MTAGAAVKTPLARYVEALGMVVGSAAVPYGYTLTTWSTGALLLHGEGAPDTAEVLLFVLGAIGAFASIGAVARAGLPRQFRGWPKNVVVLGSMHFASIGLALAAVSAASAALDGRLAWMLGSFGATAAFLLMVAAQTAVAGQRPG